MTQLGQGKNDRFEIAFKDSFGFLRTALAGATQWTDRQIRNTGIVVPHIAKTDVFSYNVQFNHDKKQGEAVADFHIHIVPIGAVTGGEVIAIDFAWGFYSFGDTIPDVLPNTTGSPATKTLVAGDQYKSLYFEIKSSLAVGSEKYSGFLFIKCTRRNDGQDTYTGEFALLGGDCHYQSDRVGSYNETTD